VTIPATPRTLPVAVAVLAALAAVAVAVLPWNLEAFASADDFAAAWRRAARFLTAFTAPDLSDEMLARGAGLAAETIAVALLGTASGLLLAYPIALGSSRAVVVGDDPLPPGLRGLLRRLLPQACRLLLDVMRGVPDFAWAILLALFTGNNAVTGTLAIAVSVAGILGKVLGEQWDNIDPQRYAALRSTGAGRLQVFLYGVQPLAGRAMLSFVLMRTECAVRNASVIGVVGGGGLGAGLWDDYSDGSWSRVATILLFMLATTAAADLAANLLRYQLRVDPNHPRAARRRSVAASTWRRAGGTAAVLLLLAGCVWWLRGPLGQVAEQLLRIESSFVLDYFGGLLTPDLAPSTLLAVAAQARVPLALGLLATLAAAGAAGLLAFPASIAFQLEAERFTGEQLPRWRRAVRVLLVVAARGAGLLLRGVPEVAWVVLLAVFCKTGVLPCVLAVALHSTGVLQRVFAETLDNVPYRRLEQVAGTCRPQIYLYGALPEAWRDWKTYVFFQFEVNVRIGVVLGMVGAGGLGDRFQSNLAWRENHRAGSYLLAMVVLTVLIDRLSRRLLLQRRKC
jgi:phosphonate transport system permease protein